MSSDLTTKARDYLHKLCVDIPTRRVGSAGNQAAVDFTAKRMQGFGFQVKTPSFDCIDWQDGDVTLRAGSTQFEASASPYALGCDVNAPLVAVSTVDELEAADLSGQIALLHGEIAGGQLMPKNFPFYKPAEHRRIIALLERKAPHAIIAATTRDPGMAGSVYPFPLFEDGDFDIPSVYMTAEDGQRLLRHAGQSVTLLSPVKRIPAIAQNMVACKGTRHDQRVVIFAHIDAKMGTPGALDNASGVITLLLLAERLADYTGQLGIEVVALNGEDYYSSPGQQDFIAQNADRFDTILLGINIDGVGYGDSDVAYSTYDVPTALEKVIQQTMAVQEAVVPGEEWIQGDHAIFLSQNRPALAFTSSNLEALLTEVAHTADDTPDAVDASKLDTLAHTLHDLLLRLNATL